MVQGVLAGRSLTELIATVPAPARAGTQALSFETLRRLGAAQAVQALVAPKAPPREVSALLLTAIALLWPRETALEHEGPPRVDSLPSGDGAGLPAPRGLMYADHTLVDQAVHAARQRTPAAAGFINAVLRRFLRERDALVAAAERTPAGRVQPSAVVDRSAEAGLAGAVAGAAGRSQPPPADDVAHQRAAHHRGGVCAAGAGQVLGEHTLVLDSPLPVHELPGFADGEVSVQDAAAQRAAPLLIGAGLPLGRARARRLRGARRQDRAPARTGRPRRAGARHAMRNV